MQQNLFQLFAEWGTRLRNRYQTDPFFLARVQLMLLYLAVGAVIFMFLGWFISSVRFSPILIEYTSLIEEGSAGQLAYGEYQRELFWRRLALVFIFVVSTYFLSEFALRSIRRSVELQNRFFGTVSHELRTPLTVMKNTAEVALRSPSIDPQKAQKVIGSLLEETDHMSRTINFLLSLSSLSMQRSIPDMQILSLREVVEETVSILRPEALKKKITLMVSLSGEELVRGNKAALQGLITNLVTNAFRYTAAEGKVTVTLEQQKRGILLTVADTGMGIPKKDLPYIFEPFYQGTQKGIEPVHDGLGLGLSLVREVSRLHNARLTVKSTEGEGTTFSIRFPTVAYPHT